MGCGSSCVRGDEQQSPPASHAYGTGETSDGSPASPSLGTASGASSPPSSKLTADDVARGGLLVLSRLAAATGVGEGVAAALTSIYQLWTCAHHKAAWCAEFITYLANIEKDVTSAKEYLHDQHHVERIVAELRDAQATLQDVLSPSAVFVVDILRVPYLQQLLAEHRAALESIRSEALSSTLIDAALDLRQAKSMIHQVMAGGDVELAVDPRGAIRAAHADGAPKQQANPNDRSILGARANASNPFTTELNQIFAVFGVIYDGFNRMERVLKERKAKAARKKAGIPDSPKDDESSRPPSWVSQFVSYLHQIEGELKQARLLLDGAVNADTFGSHVQSVASALRQAQALFAVIVERHAPADTLSLSRFLQLLNEGNDKDAIRASHNAIETAKASMMVSILTALKAESAAMAAEEMAQLQRYLDAQEQEFEKTRQVVKAKRVEAAIQSVFTPVDCSAELKIEHRRFLRGTRASVLALFKCFIGEPMEPTTPGVEVTSDPAFQSNMFLLLASPGHGKTTFNSFLVESHPTVVVGVHFFRFDMALRRNVNRAIKSVAWQAAERVPGLKAVMKEVLRKNGIEVEVDDSVPEDPTKPRATLDALTTLDLWDQLLVQPLWQLDRARREESASGDASASSADPKPAFLPRYVLLFDALDESETNGNNLLLKLLGHVAKDDKYALPPWMGLFVASRPESHVTRTLAKFISGPTTVNLDDLDSEPTEKAVPVAQSSSSLPPLVPAVSDIRFFFNAVVRTFMPSPAVDGVVPELTAAQSQCVDLLLTKSKGMFLYARLILEQRGLDLSWISREEELEELLRQGQEPEGMRITVGDISSFPVGLNNFYLDLLQRASATAVVVAGARTGAGVTMQELMRILQFMVIALEPLSLVQIKEICQYTTWEEVVRRTAALRSVVQIKAKPGMVVASSAQPTATSIVLLFHKSIRDWFISPERLEDDDEAKYHVDEALAASRLISRGWEEMQVKVTKAGAAVEVNGTSSLVLPSPTAFPLSPTADCPLLRVEDSCLPSRVQSHPHYSSTFLAYSVRYLPSHALAVCQASNLAVDTPGAHLNLQLLVNLLCHLQYMQMRTSSHFVSAGASSDTVNPEASALVKEYSMAVLLFNRLIAQREAIIAPPPTSPAPEGSEGGASSPREGEKETAEATSVEVDPTVQALQQVVRVLRAFLLFYRSEVSKFTGGVVRACVSTPLVTYCSTLLSVYQYAASYPSTHLVTQQYQRMDEWVQQWRPLAHAESSRAAKLAVEIANKEEKPQISFAASTPLITGWMDWNNKPSSRSSCIGVIREVGAVTSLACASVPQSRATIASGSLVPPTTLFAVAHEGGTFNVFDLETLTLVHGNRVGRTVNFDARPAPAPKEEGPNDDDVEPPFFTVSGATFHWEKMDLSPLNSGETRSQNMNWEAAKKTLETRKAQSPPGGFQPQRGFQSPPRFGNQPPLKWTVAPLHDRGLAAQFGNDDPAFLFNNSGIFPFPANAIRTRIVAVAFSHDGTECFVSQENSTMLSIFICDRHSGGREPSVKQQINTGNGNEHAAALALSRNDRFLVRGTLYGSVGVWTRTRRTITRGNWTGEDSSWKFKPMGRRHGDSRSTLTSVAINDDGTKVISAFGPKVHVWDVASGRHIAILEGHTWPVGAVALSGDGCYGLSGGIGMDKTLRVWALDDLIEIEDAKTDTTSEAAVVAAKPEDLTIAKRAVRVCLFTNDAVVWNCNSGLQTLGEPSLDGSAAKTVKMGVRPDTLLQAVAVSPVDSDLVVCGSELTDLQVWSIAGQKQLHTLRRMSTDTVGLTGSSSVTMSVLTGEVHSLGSISVLRFTECGRFVLGGGYFSFIYVWRVSDGEPLHCIEIDGGEASFDVLHGLDLMLVDSKDELIEYIVSASAFSGQVHTFRMHIPAEQQDGPITSQMLWRATLAGASASKTVRCIQFYQPMMQGGLASSAPKPICFVADQLGVVHLFSAVDGVPLHSFTTAAPNTLDSILQLSIIDRRGAHVPGCVRRPAQSPSASSPSSSNSVQLVTAHGFGSVSVWSIEGLLQEISSGSRVVPPSDEPSSPPPLVALLRAISDGLSQMAVDSTGHRIAVGGLDGSLCLFTHGGAATASTGSTATWRGVYDLKPEQRSQLSGLVLQMTCSE